MGRKLQMHTGSAEDYQESGFLPDEFQATLDELVFVPWKYPPKKDGTEYERDNPYKLTARLTFSRADGVESRPFYLQVGKFFYLYNDEIAGDFCPVDESGNSVGGDEEWENMQAMATGGYEVSGEEEENLFAGTHIGCLDPDRIAHPPNNTAWAQLLRSFESVTGRKSNGDYQQYVGADYTWSKVPPENKSAKRDVYVVTKVHSSGSKKAPPSKVPAKPKPATPDEPNVPNEPNEATVSNEEFPQEGIDRVTELVLEQLAEADGEIKKPMLIGKVMRKMTKKEKDAWSTKIIAEVVNNHGEGMWTLAEGLVLQAD